MTSILRDELRQPSTWLHGSNGERAAEPRPRGMRVFTAGHSFHVFIAQILSDLARSAGMHDHVALGTQFLGGSSVIDHWERPDGLNEAKRALRTGRVNVLTLSPTFHPDPGIGQFTRLAREHNPDVRITIQASWMPFDGWLAALSTGQRGRDGMTGAALRDLHEPFSQSLNAEVEALQREHNSKKLLSVVPVGQALTELREHIRTGRAPGLRSQEELFIDDLGHPAIPLQVLAAYSHFAVIYQRSPVGLPVPPVAVRAAGPAWSAGLNRLLQELAWEAVVQHPLSGVSG